MRQFKKILLVDDDLDLLEQNKVLLESRGYEVVTAENSNDALKKYRSEKPDVAIVDLIMEEYDSGFVLSYKMKKADLGKSIPVFILTSATYDTGFKFSTDSEEEQEWLACDGILNKPIVLDEFLLKLENISNN